MVKVDRRDYYRGHVPYTDEPQEIGYGGRISAPHMHAHALVRTFFSYLHINLTRLFTFIGIYNVISEARC
jgi:hypothetical protein